MDSKNLAPNFIEPFEKARIVNPAAVHFKLPRSMRINPTFHVSKVKPVRDSPLAPAIPPPPLTRLINGKPAYTIHGLLRSRRHGRELQYLVNWGRMIQRNAVGCQPALSWTLISLRPSMTNIKTSRLRPPLLRDLVVMFLLLPLRPLWMEDDVSVDESGCVSDFLESVSEPSRGFWFPFVFI